MTPRCSIVAWEVRWAEEPQQATVHGATEALQLALCPLFYQASEASRSCSERRLLRENRHVQLTLEQHGPEPCRSTYMQSFSINMVLCSQHEVASVLVDGRCRGQLWCLIFCGSSGYQGTTVSGILFFFDSSLKKMTSISPCSAAKLREVSAYSSNQVPKSVTWWSTRVLA